MATVLVAQFLLIVRHCKLYDAYFPSAQIKLLQLLTLPRGHAQPACTTRSFSSIYLPWLKYTQRLPESREMYCSAIGALTGSIKTQAIGKVPSCSETTSAADTWILLFCRFPALQQEEFRITAKVFALHVSPQFAVPS